MRYMIAAILVMALATQLTRAFPFLLYARRRPPRRLLAGARLIPGAVMTILVFTALPFSADIASAGVWLPWLSAAAVAVLHITVRHPLVSILGGTAFHMIMLQVLQLPG